MTSLRLRLEAENFCYSRNGFASGLLGTEREHLFREVDLPAKKRSQVAQPLTGVEPAYQRVEEFLIKPREFRNPPTTRPSFAIGPTASKKSVSGHNNEY